MSVAPQPSLLSIEQQITALEPLLTCLKGAASPQERLNILNELPSVREFSHLFQIMAPQFDLGAEIALKSVLAIGQGPIIFQDFDQLKDSKAALQHLIEILKGVEKFYDTIGGVIGYHLTVLKLIVQKNEPFKKDRTLHYIHPEGLDITEKNAQVRQAVRWGIEFMPIMAEIYPVGGAGDRLMLADEQTGEPLPAAQLHFGGRTVLEGLIRDLQGREYLFFKLMGRQLVTPIAMMTSHEKSNDRHIHNICLEHGWFGRPKESFLFFTQPLVPVITKEGYWSVQAPLKLMLKPGGHGILWKLAHEEKIFDVLKEKGCRKVIVRQINNPVAGIDHGLLALAGIGCKEDKAFGFASCPRLLKAPEGMNVVLETEMEGGYEYCLTNIEYTDFEQKGIQDEPLEKGSAYSAFPSNTNILFADLQSVEKAAEECPIPGLLINMKTKFPSLDAQGAVKNIEAGRLESIMQNIADFIVERTPVRLQKEELTRLKTFITFNERRKTISVTKSSYQQGHSFLGTPEGCLFEMHQNHEELLSRYCQFKIPLCTCEEEFIKSGPPFIFWYHPALGPLYCIIGQKIREGSLSQGSELQLEIAELEMNHVNIQGSLSICTDNIMEGKCILRNVNVRNQGIDFSAGNIFWKNQVVRKEEMRIWLNGNAEFVAENVTFEGQELIEVPAGYRLIASTDQEGITYKLERIKTPSWHWNYRFDDQNRIILETHLAQKERHLD